ncbi:MULTISPECIES: glutamate 5-kinase [unclassified Nitratiruptor]|uniref:glutamate 5-kinase n=1 Tax=unclassified Nitratiruptor TaxID=2624044 RepID=UPI0019359519|nr:MULTISPECIES: glutamate 5-kinase [unclassified Nitratiruptor]BCD60046.1 glutamate 5-kinase [Nitratiruptor sp. YY08-10]BCD64465.1 glutamate 5-kinase [Nitratiruptor sp. YY08-14]
MKRIVIKVGSAVLTEQNRLAKERMANLVKFLSQLHEKYEVILVSSGAVAAGYTLLKLDKSNVANKQALAAIGQPLLMRSYQKKFEKFGIHVAQVLLSADDFDSRKRTAHAKNAIATLLKNRVIPIINENDVTATEELVFGDNDQLSAHVAYYFDANLLVILSDINGLYDKDPKRSDDAKLLKEVDSIPEELLQQQCNPNYSFATGGIVTKLKAAQFLMERGVPMYLASGFDLDDATRFLLQGEHKGGTLFVPRQCEAI